MQVRMRARKQVDQMRGAVLSAVLGLAVLPSLVPGVLGVGPPVGPTAVDAILDGPAAGGRPLLVRHAGTRPVVVDTSTLTGPALRAWWVDGVTGKTVDAGSVPRGRAVTLHPPDTGDGTTCDWTLVVVDVTRGLEPPL